MKSTVQNSARAARIEQALTDSLSLQHLEVVNESGNHNVPDGAESHFKIVAVATDFDGLNRLARHRLINALLQTEFDAGMHAAAIHTYTLDEWQTRFGEAPLSPPCANG